MSLDKNEKLDINDVFTVDKTESLKEESIFTLVVGCLYTKKCVLSVEVGLSTRRKRVYTKEVRNYPKKMGSVLPLQPYTINIYFQNLPTQSYDGRS